MAIYEGWKAVVDELEALLAVTRLAAAIIHLRRLSVTASANPAVVIK
jgi:hypothetical protein